MKTNIKNLINDNKLNLSLLSDISAKPELFSKGEALFWNDPHISKKMLEAHLDPTWDAASRKPDAIDKIVAWLVKYLNLNEGAKIMDLGCGPGLYCTRFYKYKLDVTGMDYSKNSIEYAENYAEENNMRIKYIYQDYLTMDYTDEFDAIFLIYCDFGALTDADRNTLLEKVYKALKPGGFFVFDVFTKFNRVDNKIKNWYIGKTGFWKPCPHIVLDQTFHYEEENVILDQHTVIEENGKISVYKIWDHYYSAESISEVMNKHGFKVQDIWGDLTGIKHEEDSKIIGAVARK